MYCHIFIFLNSLSLEASDPFELSWWLANFPAKTGPKIKTGKYALYLRFFMPKMAKKRTPMYWHACLIWHITSPSINIFNETNIIT